MSMHIHSDMDEWFKGIDESEPGEVTWKALDGVLEEGFGQTQELVHVITGSLRGSGRVSHSHTEDSWEGSITYGGPAPGFAHPNVTYAQAEMSRGSVHNWFRFLYLLDSDFEHNLFVRAREGD